MASKIKGFTEAKLNSNLYQCKKFGIQKMYEVHGEITKKAV